MRKFVLSVCCGLLVICQALAYAQNDMSVTVSHLANGLTLLVKPDHRAPVVVSMVWYKVGGAYELPGKSGISHMLEHMMFKGTKRYGPGELIKLISTAGGQQNAFTAPDYTAYYQQLPKDQLGLAFRLEADRMHNLVLDPKAYQKELQVVKEERFMRTDDNPQALTYERVAASAFLTSPYHHPLVGWLDDLNHLTVDDVRDWYERWYAPNNAIVVVVGDVEPAAVKSLAEHYFNPLKPHTITKLKPQATPPMLGKRQVEVSRPAELPWLIMAYNVPNIKTAEKAWEPYALYMASAILDSGSSSRLPRELVRDQQIASEAESGYQGVSLFPNLFTLSGVPSKGHTLTELQQAFAAQIKRLQQQPVSAAELARVKMQVRASKTYERDSMTGQAMALGSLVANGLPWQLVEQFNQHMQAVTASQVQAVAKRYLTDKNLTVGRLHPLPIPKGSHITTGVTMGGGSVH